jgi:hypothetical protein
MTADPVALRVHRLRAGTTPGAEPTTAWEDGQVEIAPGGVHAAPDRFEWVRYPDGTKYWDHIDLEAAFRATAVCSWIASDEAALMRSRATSQRRR